MSISDSTELDIIKYVFNTTAPSWAGNTNFWIGLHIADPGDGGSAVTNQISYTGYVRPAAVRSTSGWTAANPTANVASLSTGQMTAGTGGTVTHVSVVDTVSGAGNIIASGACSPNIVVANSVTPTFAAGAITFALD